MLQTISGKPASRFSFGTMQFGGKADEAASRALYDASRDAGINFFDTAHGYTDGEAERITGRLIASERDDIFLATKAGGTKVATPTQIHKEFDESRARLALDTVDLLYVHQIDPVTPLEETLGAYRDLVQAGSVRYVGLSNHAAWQVMKGRSIAREMGSISLRRTAPLNKAKSFRLIAVPSAETHTSPGSDHVAYAWSAQAMSSVDSNDEWFLNGSR